jgi:hypothetical protein
MANPIPANADNQRKRCCDFIVAPSSLPLAKGAGRSRPVQAENPRMLRANVAPAQ